MVKKLTVSAISLLLAACAGQPEYFTLGEVTKDSFAPIHVVHNAEYVAPDLTSPMWSLSPYATRLQNTKMFADESYTGSSFGYSLWVRDELARQAIDSHIVRYTNAYGNEEYCVESGGWLVLQRKGFVAHARDQKFAEFHEMGNDKGIWREIL